MSGTCIRHQPVIRWALGKLGGGRSGSILTPKSFGQQAVDPLLGLDAHVVGILSLVSG
jgi:hypothetical protein